MCVSFIPFPASLIGLYGSQRISVVLYCGTVILTGLALYAILAYASSGNRLLEEGVPRRVVNVAGWRILGGALFYSLAIALAFMNLPRAALPVLIPLFYLFPSSIDSLIERADA